jgi:hypothetical protein
VSHNDRIVVAGEPPLSKSDREALAAKHARRRGDVASSVLAGDCLPSLERLFDYTNDLVAERAPSHVGLEDAARDVLYYAQAWLRDRENVPLAPEEALSLAFTMGQARSALNEIHGRWGTVKMIEVELSADEPRAICFGSSHPVKLEWWAAARLGRRTEGSTLDAHRFGCFRVFRDTIQTERHMWLSWCGCQTQPRRTLTREIHARLR